MRLGYSPELRSNYLVIESKAERSISAIARVAAMHAAYKRKGITRYAVSFVESDGTRTAPALLSRKQLHARGCVP